MATSLGGTGVGRGSIADAENSVSVGSAGNERLITNVAAGTALSDAVNVGQIDGAIAGANGNAAAQTTANTAIARGDALGTSTASALGGGSTYDTATGRISAPTYNVQGATYRGEAAFSGAVIVRAAPRIYVSGGIVGSSVEGSEGGRVGAAFGF